MNEEKAITRFLIMYQQNEHSDTRNMAFFERATRDVIYEGIIRSNGEVSSLLLCPELPVENLYMIQLYSITKFDSVDGLIHTFAQRGRYGEGNEGKSGTNGIRVH